jgi:hypothetical protein
LKCKNERKAGNKHPLSTPTAECKWEKFFSKSRLLFEFCLNLKKNVWRAFYIA